jgi:nucleoside-diphosphate-sugar epimerase
MKKVLILGSNGYIGSALSERLKQLYELKLVDICWFDEPREDVLVIDYSTLSENVYKMFDVVILMAGHSSVKMCEGDLINSHNNNVNNFINLLPKLKKGTKFIYASSSSVYGKCSILADEEYYDFKPYNNYDVTKHIIDLYVKRFDIEYYGLRFGTVNGYSPIVRNDVMINSMYCCAKNNGHIDLYVRDIMRPILGIGDLSNAIIKIIDSEKDLRGIYNLASFNMTSGDIANKVADLLNVKVNEIEVVEPITNIKLQTKSYDFKIDTNKFQSNFDFTFNDTIESIVSSFENKPFIETSRHKIIDYV